MSDLGDILDQTQPNVPTADPTEALLLTAQLGRLIQNVDAIGMYLENLNDRLSTLEMIVAASLEVSPENAAKVKETLEAMAQKK
jgi:hypothetical protein